MENVVFGGLIEVNIRRDNLPPELEVNFSQSCDKLQDVIFLDFRFKSLVFGVIYWLNDCLNGIWGWDHGQLKSLQGVRDAEEVLFFSFHENGGEGFLWECVVVPVKVANHGR